MERSREVHAREDKIRCGPALLGHLMLMDNATVRYSLATKDYMTPVVVYYSCLVAVGSRESGEVLHIKRDA